jgi:hypothetical protein
VFVILCFGRRVPVGDCHFHLGSDLVDGANLKNEDDVLQGQRMGLA